MFTSLHMIDTRGPGGAETVFLQLVSSLNDDGTKVIALINGDGYLSDELEKRGIETITHECRSIFDIRYFYFVYSLIKRRKIKLIHSHLLGSNINASIMGILTRVPVVATFHGMVDLADGERFIAIKLLLMKLGISKVVAVSHSLLENLRTRKILGRADGIVVYNGVEYSKYSCDRETTLRNKLKLQPDIPLFGLVGNVRTAKRYDRLIEAVAELNKLGLSFNVVVAGDTSKRPFEICSALMSERNVKNIHFLGFVEDIPGFLTNIDTYMILSESEGFSITTLEAMASGLQIIATKCGGPEEILEDGVTGELINNSKRGIIDAMEKHIRDKKRIELNHNARSAVLAKFTLEIMIDKYKEQYSKFLESGLQIKE